MTNDERIGGYVKRLVVGRGFGFLHLDVPVDGTTECFFHASVVENADFNNLAEGQRIRAVVIPSAKGPRAEAVTIVEGRR